MRRFIYTLLTITIFMSLKSANKIIYFISPPRSLSVAFLRMMQARGDFIIMHEPSQYAFNRINSPDTVNDWFDVEAAPHTFEEVKAKIFEHAQQLPVFVKEMSFAIHNFIINDLEFIKNSTINFVFLIRNPHHTILSLYKKFPNNFSEIFDSEKTTYSFSDLVGYKQLYKILCKVKEHAINPITILLTENLYNNPETTIKEFCNRCNIPYNYEALTWQDLGDEFSGHCEWHEIKKSAITHYWHQDAIRSTGFGMPTQYEVDKDGNPTFSEVSDLYHREICKTAYKENLIYYNSILNLKETT